MHHQAFKMFLEPRCRSLSPSLETKPTEMTIFVFANNKSKAVRIELTKFDLLAYNPTLDRIAQRVGMRKEGIKSLYTLNGKRVHGSQELVDGGGYVGVSGTDRFRKMSYFDEDHEGFHRKEVCKKKDPVKVKPKAVKDSFPCVYQNTSINNLRNPNQGYVRGRTPIQLNTSHDFRQNYRRITGNSLDTLGTARLRAYELPSESEFNIHRKHFQIPFYQEPEQSMRKKQNATFKYTVKHQPGSQEQLALLQSKGVPYYSNVHPENNKQTTAAKVVLPVPMKLQGVDPYDSFVDEMDKKSRIYHYNTSESETEAKYDERHRNTPVPYSPFERPWSAMTDVPEETSQTKIENPCPKESYYSMLCNRVEVGTDSADSDDESMIKFLHLDD